MKATPTNKAYGVYGDAGNVVHKSIERWLGGNANPFEELWQEYNIDSQVGMGNTRLSKSHYLKMFQDARGFIRNNWILNCERFIEHIVLLELNGMNLKAIMDLVVIDNAGDIFVYDWKTDSSHDFDKHAAQRLFYSYMIFRKTGKIPTCRWVYLSKGGTVDQRFTLEQIEMFEKELVTFIDNLEQLGDDVAKYEAGEWKNPFNVYSQLCASELERRLGRGSLKIRFVCKGNFIFIENAPDKLIAGLDLAFKFDLPDKFFIQQAVKKKQRGKIDLRDVGTVHLFNPTHKCFPLGMLEKVKKIIKEYEEFYKRTVEIDFIDARNKDVLARRITIERKKDWALRDYQLTAANIFQQKKQGILQIPTGGGKTITAVDIIYRLKCTTLWIIDRLELLNQTKETLEKFFGEENVGSITGKSWEVHKPITIATVQSLHSRLDVLADYLYHVNFVIVDEYHKSAAETYQKVFAKLPHADYRLGLTATPMRDDGKEPILFSQIGDICFQITADKLMQLGYLVRPTIKFIKLESEWFGVDEYAEDYKKCVVEHSSRTRETVTLACRMFNLKKKVLILTKQIAHAKHLCSKMPVALHIHGSLDEDTRKKHMESFKQSEPCILVMTQSIGAEGLDIPDLDVIINAAANKGDTKSLQTLGRVLRSFEGKASAVYYDFIDVGPFTFKHSQARMELFKNQGYEIEVLE